MTYNEMKSAVLGCAYDIDGAYGAQCWDGVMFAAMKFLGFSHAISCTRTGFVKDIATDRATNGILNFCDDVGLETELEPGDICIWGNCQACPDSHIAFYDHDNGQNAVYFLGQNQGGYGGAFNIAKIDTSGIIGVFRPHALKASNPGKGWNINGVVKKGSHIISGILHSAVCPGWHSAFCGDEVYIPELDPLKDAGPNANHFLCPRAWLVDLGDGNYQTVEMIADDVIKFEGQWVIYLKEGNKEKLFRPDPFYVMEG